MKTHIGCKFYKYLDDTEDFSQVEILRLVRFKNQTTYVMMDKNGMKIKKTVEELQRDYTKLAPDGFMSLSNVVLRNTFKDVVITLHRREEIEKGDDTPYVVCRQNIYDFFTNQLNYSESIQYIGMSISEETRPKEITMSECSVCDKVLDSQVIDVYMEDKFEDILGFFDTKESDKILADLKEHAPSTVIGWTGSVEELMKETRFMYDFLRAFNIHPLNFQITVQEDGTLPYEQIVQLEDLVKYKINRILAVPYAKDIDLSAVKNTHIVVSDTDQNVYVIMYEPGEYINRPYEKLEDHRDRDAMINAIKNRIS